jgi:hypothetical protein
MIIYRAPKLVILPQEPVNYKILKTGYNSSIQEQFTDHYFTNLQLQNCYESGKRRRLIFWAGEETTKWSLSLKVFFLSFFSKKKLSK